MNFIELESERLIYRKFKKEDFSIIFDMFSNAENMKYRSGEPKNETETRNYINWAISCAEAEECENFKYAVVLKADNSLICSCEIYYTHSDPSLLAWELHRDYWRQGYGTENGKTLLKFGFDTLNLRRIVADCNARNRGSYRIMELIGMRREAHFTKAKRGNSVLNYEWCDSYQYAILQEEWLAAKDRE
jgi:RimJ/RimL family protein N-acetyltransferase